LPENLLIAEEFKKSSSLLRENKAAAAKVFKYQEQSQQCHVPFESMMNIDFVNYDVPVATKLVSTNLSGR
jgi:hypothetical protein